MRQLTQPVSLLARLLLQCSISFLFLAAVGNSASAQVRSLGLREIVATAGSSFIGTVTRVTYGYDERHDIVTYTTFRVEENISGATSKTVTLKQLGGIVDGLDTRVEHIRYFQPGERVLVSVYANSSMGFSNPVGLDQGVWRVTAKNEILDVTPTQLKGLDAELKQVGIAPALAHQIEPQALTKASFVSLVRTLATAKKGENAR